MERYKRDIQIKLTEHQNSYRYETIKLSDIQTEKDNIMLKGVKMPITELFVKSLCKVLRIPYKYATYINADLYEDNINTLISERPDDEMLLCINGDRLINIIDTSKKKFFLPDIGYILEGIKIRESLQEMWWIEDYGYAFMFYGEGLADEYSSYGYLLKVPMFLADKAITMEHIMPIDDIAILIPDTKNVKFSLMVKDKDDAKLSDKIIDKLNAFIDNAQLSFLDGYMEGFNTTIISRENINKVFTKVFKWNKDLLFEFGIEDANDLKEEKSRTDEPTITFNVLLNSIMNVDINAVGLDVYYKLINNRWISKMYGKQRKVIESEKDKGK